MTDYPRPSVTADCIVFDADRVLLIKRGKEPYAGRWALPGGFLNPGETIEEAAARELLEETGLTEPGAAPVGSIRRLQFVGVFSKPDRDPRGWVVAVAFTCDLQDSEDIRVKAGDDAAEAQWFSVLELPDLAFDHRDIIDRALAVIEQRKRRWR